jgi:histidinol dehydrogenase
MSADLSKILLSSSTPQWRQKLRDLQRKLFEATYFEPDDERTEQLMNIIKAVKDTKDQALQEFTQKFDGVSIPKGRFRVSKDELKEAYININKELLASIRCSIANVRKYQQKIFIGKSPRYPIGTRQRGLPAGTGIKYTPIKRVGICVPGASAPLPSTVVMTAVPAQVAGVEEIVVISPPRYKGGIHPVSLAVCFELKIDEVYAVGGAQAVAALAYGTESINPVNKIVGPGNAWVQMAKRAVFGVVDIDSIAGPSEVLIIANDKANPAFVAADMLSQAEHAPGSALLFTDSEKLAKDVLAELEKQLAQLDRLQETMRCLLDFSGMAVFEGMKACIEQANFFAPEHLEIQCGKVSRKIAKKIENAGAIFIGDFSPVAVGDYWAGPSHSLPTGMTAKFFGALSSNDFIKSTSIIEYDKKKLAESADDIIRLAQTEGLDAHAKSIQIRQRGFSSCPGPRRRTGKTS